VSYGFDAFQLDTAVFTKDLAKPSEGPFLDFNNDGQFNTAQITTAQEFRLRTDTAANTIYLDVNGLADRNPSEPQASRNRTVLFVPQSAVDLAGMTVNFNGITRNVLTRDGLRFIDLDGNGALTRDPQGRPLEPWASQSAKLAFEDIARTGGQDRRPGHHGLQWRSRSDRGEAREQHLES